MRVAITGPPDVIAVLQRAAGGRVSVVPVGPFAPEQRDEYLARRLGDVWVRVPSDVRDTLRRPLLAGIYCDEVAEPGGWRPTDEYDLYDRMWERLRVGPHAPGPFDALRLGTLAATVLENQPYPWPSSALDRAQIDTVIFDRLQRAGWLRSAPHQRFEIPHDRLLNYAVARGLQEAHRDGRLQDGRLAEICRQLLVESVTYGGRRLGYVPMDLFHFLLTSGAEGESAFTRLLSLLDDLGHHERDVLYGELLPTLGREVVPQLYTRLAAILSDDADFRQRQIVDGIVAFDTPEVRDSARRLIESASPQLHRAGMRVLAKRPDPAAMDRLWFLHGQMQAQPERFGEEPGHGFALYRESMGAMRACVATAPTWIERAVVAAQSGEPHIQDLAYLLAGLPDGMSVWHRCKGELFAKVPPNRMRSVALNVGRYRDEEEVGRLLPLVTVREDSAAPAAIGALARINPDLAVDHLAQLSAVDLHVARGWYLPHLLEVRPLEVNRRLLQVKREADDPWRTAYAYSGSEDDLDVDTLDFLLDRFDTMLRQLVEEPPPPNRHPLLWPLGLLVAVSRLDLLERFRRRRRTELGRRLADFLVALGPQQGRARDSAEREPALELLAKIGGNNHVRVINDYLAKGDSFGRFKAISAAHRVGDADTRRLLAAISRQDELGDGSPPEQQKATNALAALGETRLLVEAVTRLGLRISVDLDSYVSAPRPFDDDAVSPATAQLIALEAEAGNARVAAVIALGMAGRRDQLPIVLDLLAGAAADSDLALACTIALEHIGDGDSRTVDLLARQLAGGRIPMKAHLALLGIGTEPALSVALEHVRRTFDPAMAVNLARREQTREAALDLIAGHVAAGGPRHLDDRLQIPLAYLDDAAIQRIVADGGVREALREIALAEESSF